jgi:hypothetical protein
MGHNLADPVDRARLIILTYLAIESGKSSRIGPDISEPSQQPHRLFDNDYSITDAWVSVAAIIICILSSMVFLCWYFFR